eukprot:2062074-Rhodomonas_salina.1
MSHASAPGHLLSLYHETRRVPVHIGQTIVTECTRNCTGTRMSNVSKCFILPRWAICTGMQMKLYRNANGMRMSNG